MSAASAVPVPVASPVRSASARRDGAPAADERIGLEGIAEAIAASGDRFVESLYARFFTLCPDARPIFGEHSISEQEEMVAETFRAIVAWVDGEPRLATNLDALGESHVEYGVEDAMYRPFVDALVETAASCAGQDEASPGIRMLRESLEVITTRMSVSGHGRPNA